MNNACVRPIARGAQRNFKGLLAFSVVLLGAALNPADAGAAAPNALVCGHDSGGDVEHGSHFAGNHRFGPQYPHHFPGAGQRHFGHHDPHQHQFDREFVKRVGSHLKLHGDDFRFAGTNNYYSAYKSELMVDDVLGDADDQGFTVLRTWAFIDIGNQDGTGSVSGKADGAVYYHFLNGAAPGFNDGPDGLQHLDYVVFKAGQLGIKLVLPLTNNWPDFGGMDQYVSWAGDQFHDQFYTDPKIRGWYKDWVSHVLNHKNFYTGVKLKDDPTIMTWELANEPRCDGGDFPRSANCTSATLTTWANEMSTYIKRLDPKHLVSMGDEGFYCDPTAADPFDHCADGVDTVAFTSLPNIDVMSFHLYPDSWNQTVAWGQQWIERHFADAMAHGKPAMLGEFGLLDTTRRNPNYKLWTDTAFEVGGAGALYWMLAGIQDDGSLYPDFDGYTVYCPSPVCEAYSHFSHEMTAERTLPFAPVADDDIAETVGVKPVTLNLIANDVTYNGTTLIQSSVDLDPTTAGQQVTLQTANGLFVAASDGTVRFIATAGFTGNATATYTVNDSRGRLSGPATVSVTVKPDPRAPQLLFSFEDGTESWAAASFNAAGTVAQSADFASLGNFSLKITPNAGGGWFGVEYATPVDLSTRSHVLWEVKTTNSPTSQELALQTGDTFAFCTVGGFQFIQANTTATIDVDLAQLDCGGTAVDLKKVHSFLIFAGNGGPDPLYIDNVRATPLPPTAPPLYGFEDGTDNWLPASFNASAGTTEQSSDFATEGSFGLKINPTGGGWFGVEYATPISLAGKTHVLWDIKTTTSGTSLELALQTGTHFDFCSAGGFQFLNANGTSTIDIDLAQLDCGGATPDLSQVHSFLIFLGNSGSGPIYLDNIRVTAATPPLYGFETGTDNWAPASFNSGAGTTAQSADFATEGSFSLKITPTGGGWFGVEYASPISLAGKTHVTWDLKTTASGTPQELALQTGPSFDFCSAGGFQFVGPNTTTSIDIDLTTLDCGGATPDLTQIHNFYIFMGNSGPDPLYIDNVQAK